MGTRGSHACGDSIAEKDNWQHRSKKMLCKVCMFWVEKVALRFGRAFGPEGKPGRCRRHAPTMSGWPAVFETDWCGDHKVDETKI